MQRGVVEGIHSGSCGICSVNSICRRKNPRSFLVVTAVMASSIRRQRDGDSWWLRGLKTGSRTRLTGMMRMQMSKTSTASRRLKALPKPTPQSHTTKRIQLRQCSMRPAARKHVRHCKSTLPSSYSSYSLAAADHPIHLPVPRRSPHSPANPATPSCTPPTVTSSSRYSATPSPAPPRTSSPSAPPPSTTLPPSTATSPPSSCKPAPPPPTPNPRPPPPSTPTPLTGCSPTRSVRR